MHLPAIIWISDFGFSSFCSPRVEAKDAAHPEFPLQNSDLIARSGYTPLLELHETKNPNLGISHRSGGIMGTAMTPATRLARLSSVLDGARSMLIIVQNTPDPDAIAAAAALRELAKERHEIACSIGYSGGIWRAENLALLRYLSLNTRLLSDLDLDRFDRLAMVDAQPGAGNVSFDASIRLDVVIDHHPIRRETRSARFTDVRSRYGATSTILYEYLKAANIEIPTPVATAMIYGIRSDTQDLGRESTKADVEAFLDLYPLANARAIGRIVQAPLPRSYFSKLRAALDEATVYGDRIVSFLGHLESPEMIAEAADLLLRAEEVRWALTFGVVDNWLHVSIRARDRDRHAGRIARNLAGRRGFGGGHQALAAAQIPLNGTNGDRQIRKLLGDLTKRFLRATGNRNAKGKKLCS
jgi:nanoRNase/pAp phosphatase (c-di-AMP/oligoRNAs hydrolase)